MKEGVGRALRRAIGRDDVLSRIKSRKGGVSVLMNSKRRAIFQHLIDNPLTHLREIARDMEIPVGTVSWHLKALTEAKAVDFFKGKRKCLYYPSDWIEKEDISCLSILQSRISRTLYSSLVKTPGLSQTELAGRLRKYQQYIQPRIVDL
ncbi:MAG: winged helix-turn-helix transcriptional regulator [Thermoplasmata archaeon]